MAANLDRDDRGCHRHRDRYEVPRSNPSGQVQISRWRTLALSWDVHGVPGLVRTPSLARGPCLRAKTRTDAEHAESQSSSSAILRTLRPLLLAQKDDLSPNRAVLAG